jgi:hypothetical protein
MEEIRDESVGDRGDDREKDEGRQEAETQREGGPGLCRARSLVGCVMVCLASVVGQVLEGL